MAELRTINPLEGETRVGPFEDKSGGQGVFYVQSTKRQGDIKDAGKGSVIALDSRDASGNGLTWYVYITSGGLLVVTDTFPTNTELVP